MRQIVYVPVMANGAVARRELVDGHGHNMSIDKPQISVLAVQAHKCGISISDWKLARP